MRNDDSVAIAPIEFTYLYFADQVQFAPAVQSSYAIYTAIEPIDRYMDRIDGYFKTRYKLPFAFRRLPPYAADSNVVYCHNERGIRPVDRTPIRVEMFVNDQRVVADFLLSVS